MFASLFVLSFFFGSSCCIANRCLLIPGPLQFTFSFGFVHGVWVFAINSTMATTVLLFYKYADLGADRVPDIATWQRALCECLQLEGRVLLASEGINGSLAGTEQAINAYCNALASSKFVCALVCSNAFVRVSVRTYMCFVCCFVHCVAHCVWCFLCRWCVLCVRCSGTCLRGCGVCIFGRHCP